MNNSSKNDTAPQPHESSGTPIMTGHQNIGTIFHLIYIGVILVFVGFSTMYYFQNLKILKINQEELALVQEELDQVSKELDSLNTELDGNLPKIFSYLDFPCEGVWRGCYGNILKQIKEEGAIVAILEPTDAIQGNAEVSGPTTLGGDLSNSKSCLDGVFEKDDEQFCVVEMPHKAMGGVAEIYFTIPSEYAEREDLSYIVHADLGCKSGFNILEETKYSGWRKIGSDLDSSNKPEGYKPDGTYGYLSCPYDGLSDVVLEVPITPHGERAGLRIVMGEVTARALVDRVYIQVIQK